MCGMMMTMMIDNDHGDDAGGDGSAAEARDD